MTRIFLTSIVALLLATGTTAHAGHREQAILGKPRIIVRHITIRGSLQPPSKYDVPYTGELEILYVLHSEDVQAACPDAHSDTACALVPKGSTAAHEPAKKCRIIILTEDALKKKGYAYNFSLRHELAHCNGWWHPNTTNGKHFSVGEKWDEVEGGKWVAADTVRPAPKLPENTRILPPPSQVVCVTLEWKQEPCKNRVPTMAGIEPPRGNVPVRDACADDTKETCELLRRRAIEILKVVPVVPQ